MSQLGRSFHQCIHPTSGNLNPIALLQIAIPAQELHITDGTCATLTVRNDVIELQVGTWATNTALDTLSLITLPDSIAYILWDMTAICIGVETDQLAFS